MAVVIAMLRGVNVGGYQKLNMEALRTLCGRARAARRANVYPERESSCSAKIAGIPWRWRARLEDGDRDASSAFSAGCDCSHDSLSCGR